MVVGPRNNTRTSSSVTFLLTQASKCMAKIGKKLKSWSVPETAPKYAHTLRSSSSNSRKPPPMTQTLTQSNKFKSRIKPTIQKAHQKMTLSSPIILTFWERCILFYLFSVEYSANQGPFNFWQTLIDHQESQSFSAEDRQSVRKSSFEECEDSDKEIEKLSYPVKKIKL